MKKFLIVLIIVFICGVLSADVCLKQVEDSAVVVGRDVYEQYATAKLTFKHVFWNILYELEQKLYVNAQGEDFRDMRPVFADER